MFTLENLITAGIALGVIFLLLGLLIFDNIIRIRKNQIKDFDLLIDFIEEKMKPLPVVPSYEPNLSVESSTWNQAYRENIKSIEHQLKIADLQSIRIALEGILTQIKLGDLESTKTAIYQIIENQEKMEDAKANITISAGASDKTIQQVNNTFKLTTENIDELVGKLKPFLNENSKDTVISTNNTGSLVLATIAVTEVILAELHDVETIYDDSGAVTEKISEDYNRTYDVIFKTLTENLL